MDTTWIVCANAGRARIFAREQWASPLEEIEDRVNPAAHLRTAQTESDELGQLSASKSIHSVGAPTQPSGYQPNQTPAEHQTELFARDVAECLRQAHHEGRFSKLMLLASPGFLGVLRKQLDPQLLNKIALEINKDYTQLANGQLGDRIREQERPG